MIPNAGLVLEGGGMRGVFTAGVLDCLLDNKIYFPYVIGASAGTSNGLSYISRQRGRARFCSIDQLVERKYIGFKYLLTQGCIMDYEYLFGELPKEVYPYDMEAYMNAGRFVFVLTNCITGKSEYFEKPDTFDSILDLCRASCSLPYVCPIAKINSVPYMDGGLSDGIPLARAQADGYKKNLVVLTRNKGYVKGKMYNFLASILYKKYPNFLKCLKETGDIYNAKLAEVDAQENDGNTIVIRPLKPLEVDRLEHNADRLNALYDEGYRACKAMLPKILEL